MATLRPLFQLISYKTGLSENGPSNAAWQERNRRHRRYRSGYIQSGESSSIRMQRYSTTIVSAEDSKATHHCTIEVTQPKTPMGQAGNTSQLTTTMVRKTIEVTVTKSRSRPTEEYHAQEMGDGMESRGELVLHGNAGVRLY